MVKPCSLQVYSPVVCIGTPVLIDDIISTGRTMIETIAHLKHAYLLAAGAPEVVTCNTITHASNRIDVARLIADAVSNSSVRA